MFLKECKDTEKEKWLIRYINGDLETTSEKIILIKNIMSKKIKK